MKTLEDILTDYCGCFGPALNDKDEKFTTSGTEAYEYLRGKKMHIYESWNGSSMTIIVENVEIFTKSVLFSGTNSYWGGKSGIYVDIEYLDELLSKGCATKHNTIERCDVTTSWTIK